jgi:hypothetical protein
MEKAKMDLNQYLLECQKLGGRQTLPHDLVHTWFWQLAHAVNGCHQLVLYCHCLRQSFLMSFLHFLPIVLTTGRVSLRFEEYECVPVTRFRDFAG